MSRNGIVGTACLMLAALLSSGCASTKVVGEWRDPDVVPTGPYANVFIAGVTTQVTVRRQLEDAFQTALAPFGAKTASSQESLPMAAPVSREDLIEAIKASGADAALVVRMVKKESEVVVTQDYYGPRTIYGGYRSAWAGQYSPVSVQQYDVITLEARLYDVATEKLAWAISTETTDPGKIQKEMAAYATLICEQMAKAGLLAKRAP